MAGEIINRVANSPLINIDLEDFYPVGERILFDIKDWLFQGMILKEKEFRQYVQAHDWSKYQDTYVALTCSEDAIIPSWAYLLLSTKLAPYAKRVVVGDLILLETVLFQEIVINLDIETYKDKPVIIKGCTNKPIPASAYSFLIHRIQSVAKNITYGEACSTVPLFKRTR